MAQMKAIRVEEFGEPEVLRHADVERPSPGGGEVLLEVRSAGVNYADTIRRRNQYLETQDLPFTPGSEVAGTVAEVGEGVEDVAAGDRVVTLLGTGGYAEYALAPARSLIPLPEGVDVILEMIGSDFPEKNLQCLNVFGRMVVFGAASKERGTIVPAALMKKCHAVVGFYLPQVMRRPDLFVPSLQEVLAWISSGELKLTIGGAYPLAQAAAAHSDLEGRKTTGKLVLNP